MLTFHSITVQCIGNKFVEIFLLYFILAFFEKYYMFVLKLLFYVYIYKYIYIYIKSVALRLLIQFIAIC